MTRYPELFGETTGIRQETGYMAAPYSVVFLWLLLVEFDSGIWIG
jgi:hypothetical protein